MNLKQFLKSKKMSAYSFAKKSGLNRQTIFNIMHGVKPRLRTALKIEEASNGVVKIYDTYKKTISY